jgi:hypothetical protein
VCTGDACGFSSGSKSARLLAEKIRKEESCACTSAYLADQNGGGRFLDLTAPDSSVSVNWTDKTF